MNMGFVDVKEWLRTYQGLKYDFDSWNDKHTMLEHEAYDLPAVRTSDGVKGSGGVSDRMCRATAELIQFEQETKDNIDAIKRKMKAIETAISDLPDPMHRGVLRQRYIVGYEGYKLKPWRIIAQALYHKDDESSYKRAQRLHTEAINSMASRHPPVHAKERGEDCA